MRGRIFEMFGYAFENIKSFVLNALKRFIDRVRKREHD